MNAYKAKLTGNQLEWIDGAPQYQMDQSIQVEVVIQESLIDSKKSERGKKMAASLEKIAQRGGVAEIPDPVQWQREIRKDRPLPGREKIANGSFFIKPQN